MPLLLQSATLRKVACSVAALLGISSVLPVIFILYCDLTTPGVSPRAVLLPHTDQRHFYYVDFAPLKYNDPNVARDANGVPVYEHNGYGYYHPVIISQFALGALDSGIRHNDGRALSDFIACAQWLRDNLALVGDMYLWEYHFPFAFGDFVFAVPWHSAMAQGEGVSVLTRAFLVTGERRYLKAARRAIRSLAVSGRSGGLTVRLRKAQIFPQEYPTEPPSHVLNGAIFAYLGILDYYRTTNKPSVGKLQAQVLDGLINLLSRYDIGYWSLYSLEPSYVSDIHYHQLHIQQLRVLHSISGERQFQVTADRWERYAESYVCRFRWIVASYRQKLFRWGIWGVLRMPTVLSRYL